MCDHVPALEDPGYGVFCIQALFIRSSVLLDPLLIIACTRVSLDFFFFRTVHILIPYHLPIIHFPSPAIPLPTPHN